jgi:predicted nucleic acid-binding Zn ribbon protein
MFSPRLCPVCGRSFNPVSGHQTVCSTSCRVAHRKRLKQQRWARLSPEERANRLAQANAKRLPVLRICETCGVEFSPRKADQQRCSRACVDTARRKTPAPTVADLPPDPEGERRFQEACARLRGADTEPAARPRHSFYGKRLQALGLPPNVRQAARAIGVSGAAMWRRVLRHLYNDPKRILKPARPYRRKMIVVGT